VQAPHPHPVHALAGTFIASASSEEKRCSHQPTLPGSSRCPPKAAASPGEPPAASPHATASEALNEQIQVGPASWAAASETGSTDFGPATAELENKTRLLSNYRPATVPGLLQTPAYARRLLSSGPAGESADIGTPVINRIERQKLLYDEAEPEAVQMCRQAFANLLGASATGDDARRLISAAAHDLHAGDD
jgi:hypothetical protein